MIIVETKYEHDADATRGYFEAFLPALRGELLIPDLHSLDCTLGVRIEEQTDAAWTLGVQSGRLEVVTAGLENAECVFCLDTVTLLAVVAGALAPDKAFFDLRIEIEGDVALGLQLSTVLAPFFRQYPFRWPAA